MKKKAITICFTILLVANLTGNGNTTTITIDASAPAKPVRFHNFYGGYHHNRFYFERSTAFKRMHDIFKECAHKRPTMKYWRCQNLLTYRNDPNNRKKLKGFTEVRAGHPYDTERYTANGGYNWKKVDEVFDEIVNRSGLTPVVEFNYMPECMAKNPEEIGSYGLAVISPPKKHDMWRDLIKNTVTHLQSRYGVQETRKWYWGVWNEPNHKFFWNFKKHGYDGFIKLYDYAAIPLKQVDNALKIGGPDNTAVLVYSKRFVRHTLDGTNYCNGQVGSPADYFSVHAYSTSVRFICSEAWRMARDVREIYGSDYKNKSILVTEMAPNYQMGDMPYLQNRYTAAWLLGVFDAFLEAADIHGEFYLPKTIHYCGIIRDFGDRSLMVYIGQDNNSNEILKTAPFNVYEVLSFLSEQRIPVQGCDFPQGFVDVTNFNEPDFNQFRCLATRTPGRSIEILIYHLNQNNRLVYNKKDNGKDPDRPYGTYYRDNPRTHLVNLQVNNIPFAQAKCTKYVIDKHHSNSAAYRTMHGNTNNYNVLNAHDDLEQTENKKISISNGQYSETMFMQENSVMLIILENENVGPGPHLGLWPTSVDFGAYTNTRTVTISNYGDQQLSWTAQEYPEQTWITSVDPSSGTLTKNSTESMNITVDRNGLADGNYDGTISITSDGGDQNIDILMYGGAPPLPSIYRINTGGGLYTDLQGNTWSSDRSYNPGGFGYEGGMSSSTQDPIDGTGEDVLYQSERYKMNAYRFDVPNGNFEVTLHFAEIYFRSSNERIMSVDIEGEPKIVDLDIFQQVGHDVAEKRTFSNIPVTDGRIDITFSARSRAPQISAIEVKKMKSGSADTTDSGNNMPSCFKYLDVYQKAFELAMEIFNTTKNFPAEEKNALTNQIRKSSRSVCSNIGSGYRNCQNHTHFLAKITEADMQNIETQVLLDIAFASQYINKDVHDDLIKKSEEIGQMLKDMLDHPEKYRGR